MLNDTTKGRLTLVEMGSPPFQVLTRRIMPLIPNEYLNTTVYLYLTEDAAREGAGSGGSGFLTSIPSVADPNKVYVYIVTNRHVVLSGGTVARLTDIQGNTQVLSIDPFAWHYDRNGNDVAICSLGLHSPPFQYGYVPARQFLTQLKFLEEHIGPGDDVFMVGRFVGYDGKQKNTPSVRFGHVSLMSPEAIKHDGNYQYSFLVEAHSIAGYSGSPVFLHIPPDNWRPNRPHDIGQWVHYFLGVDCGHVLSRARVVDEKTGRAVNDDWVVKTNTGMMVVVPAWDIALMLESRVFAKARQEEEHRLSERNAEGPTENDLALPS